MEPNTQTAPWQLRPYQIDALRAISESWKRTNRTLVVAATGTGKTTIFAEVAKRRRDAGRGRTLVLAHRTELLDQAAERMRLVGLTAELESGDRVATVSGMFPSDVVIATVQTLKGKRLLRWPPSAFGTIIVDEAHHACAAGYRAVLDHFAAAKILGVTATPDRGDGIALGGVIDDLAFEYSLRDGIRDGYLCPLRFLAINTPSIDMSTVRTTKQDHGRDLSASDLAKQMTLEKPLHEMAAPIVQEMGDRQTIVFVPSVEVAHELARVMAAYMGAPGRVASLDGETHKDIRRDTLDRYKRGEIQALVNCALFTEGFDAPSTSCVAIARPTKSRALYAQMVGRGTRVAPGKTDCLILDLAPDNARHELVSPIDLFAGKDLDEAALEEARAGALAGEDVEKLLAEAEKRARLAEAARKRERNGSKLVADVKYTRFARDPFAILGVDSPGVGNKVPVSERIAAALLGMGVEDRDIPGNASQANALFHTLKQRRKDGLCSFKQARQLAKRGLRVDLSFADASAAMDALSKNEWRMTPELAEKFGV